MKRIAAAAALFALAPAWAAVEKIVEIKIAPAAELKKAVTTLGNMAGQPMFGMMANAWFANNELTATYGALREAPAVITVWADAAKPIDSDEFDASVHYAALYPTSADAKTLLDANPAAVETNGCIKADDSFVRYLKTPGYAVITDCEQLLTAAAADAAKVAPMAPSECVKLQLTAAGAKLLKAMVDKAIAEGGCLSIDKFSRDFCAAMGGCEMSLSVAPDGIELRTIFVPVAGGKLLPDGVGSVDPMLAFAKADASMAVVSVMAKGLPAGNHVRALDTIKGVLAKYNFKLDFLKCLVRNGIETIELDLDKLVDYARTELPMAAAGHGDPQEVLTKIGEDFIKAVEDPSLRTVSVKTTVNALSIKGFKRSDLSAAVFKRLYPTLPSVQIVYAGEVVFYRFIRDIAVSIIAKFANVPSLTPVAALVSALSPAANDGMAYYMGKDGDKVVTSFKIAAGEIKGLAELMMNVQAFIMQQMAMSGCDDDDCGDCDDDDCGDCDDDED